MVKKGGAVDKTEKQEKSGRARDRNLLQQRMEGEGKFYVGHLSEVGCPRDLAPLWCPTLISLLYFLAFVFDSEFERFTGSSF